MIETLFTNDPPTLSITYKAANDAITSRAVQPIGVRRLKTLEPAITAWCTLRRDTRTFGLNRILSLQAQDDTTIPLRDWMRAPLQRYDLFEDLKKTGTRVAPTKEQQTLLEAQTPDHVQEGLVWWEDTTCMVYADTKFGTWMRSQSGHVGFHALAQLQGLTQLRGQAPTGAIAFFRQHTNTFTLTKTHRL